MPATLVQHKHCPSCGKAILLSQTTCSEECEAKQEKIRRDRKRLILLWMASFVLIIMLFVFSR